MAQGKVETLDQLDETMDEANGQLDDIEATIKDALAVATQNKAHLPTAIPSKLLELAATLSRARQEFTRAWDLIQDELGDMDELEDDEDEGE